MRSFIYYVGLGTLLWFVVKALLFTFSVRPSKSPLARYKRGDETWALVIGGSDGIGYGLAQELVSHGFNVILQGRNKQKLETAKAKLEAERLGAKIRLLVIDAVAGSTRDLEKEIASVQHLNITILVNNVGAFHLA